MKRRFALALGALSLSWLGGAALADEPIKAAPAAAPAVVAKPEATGAIILDHGPCAGGCASHGGSFNAGVGFYYIQPYWQSNQAFFAIDNTAPGITLATQQDLSYDFTFNPRAWIGYSDCSGAGARLRWWQFDDSTSAGIVDDSGTGFAAAGAPLGVAIFTGGTALNPDNLFVDSDLKLHVWDLEGTYAFSSGCWTLTTFGGVRYAHISQSYNAATVDTLVVLNDQVLLSGHNFRGWGPTAGLETRRGMGALSIYGSTRGSLLFGDHSATAAAAAFDPVTGGLVGFQGATTERDDLLPILEVEVGAEYGYDLGGARLVLQAALVGQVWFGAGNAANSQSPDVLGPLAGGSEQSNANLGFFGLTISAGVNY